MLPVAGAAAAETGACADPLAAGYSTLPPFDIPTKNDVSGINGEILSTVAARMGCRVTWHQRPWKRLLAELRQGELDVIGGAFRTAERAQYAHFSHPYMPYRIALFVDAEDHGRYARLRRFLETRQSLGVVRGYTYGAQADAQLANSKYAPRIYRMYAMDESVRALAMNRVGGILGNPHVVARLAREHGISERVRRTGVTVHTQPIRFMFSKKAIAEPVVQRFNETLRALKAEGRIRRIVNTYTRPGRDSAARTGPAKSPEATLPDR